MIAAMDHTKAPERKAAPPKVKRYAGEVVYIFAFDVAYEMTRQPVRELLGQSVAQFSVDASKRSPRQLFFYRPQMVRLPPLERIGPHGPVRVERVIKLLPVGAISISVRVPFEVEQVEDLVCYHDLQFSNGSLSEEVRRLAEEVRAELAPHYVRPVGQLAEEEAYTVFCIESPLVSEEGVECERGSLVAGPPAGGGVAAHAGAGHRPSLEAGGGRVDGPIPELLRARPGGGGLGRRADY